jgi:hypothetical protein
MALFNYIMRKVWYHQTRIGLSLYDFVGQGYLREVVSYIHCNAYSFSWKRHGYQGVCGFVSGVDGKFCTQTKTISFLLSQPDLHVLQCSRTLKTTSWS